MVSQYSVFTALAAATNTLVAGFALLCSFRLYHAATIPGRAALFDFLRAMTVTSTGISLVCIVGLIVPTVWTDHESGIRIVPQLFWICWAAGCGMYLQGRCAEMAGRHPMQDAEGVELSETRAALARAESRFRLFMDNLPGIAWIADEHGTFLYVCQRYVDFFGRQASEYLGKQYAEMFPPETAAAWMVHRRAVFEKQLTTLTVEETPPIGALPGRRWLVNCFPIIEPDGTVLVGGIGVDITNFCSDHNCQLLQRASQELPVPVRVGHA